MLQLLRKWSYGVKLHKIPYKQKVCQFSANRSENTRESDTHKIANDGRPNPNKPFRRQFTPAPNGRANTSNRTNVNVVQSSLNRGKKEIKGYCSLNGKPVPFLVDTGAIRSVVSQRVLESTASMRPFTSQATTADGAELKIEGVQDCLLKIGDSSYMTSVLVAPDLQQEFLMEMDVLNKCNETREHVDGLRHAVKEASDKFINSLDPKEIEEMNQNEL